MIIRKSAEDYLEKILMLKKSKGFARSIDVARDLGVSKPSVSVAVKSLKENGYIAVSEDGFLNLTPSGLEIANRMLKRHETLSLFFQRLGVSEDTAIKDACLIEHDISEESFNAICEHVNKK